MQTFWQSRLSPHCSLFGNVMAVRPLIQSPHTLLMSCDFCHFHMSSKVKCRHLILTFPFPCTNLFFLTCSFSFIFIPLLVSFIPPLPLLMY
ncbi:hypothetical protein XELAEV_18021971mg [Xenopus laevis]|uniref:Uncharacterized protein n=1 Tax=Xenopus laevis TaxID=8355 RepID=A0A974D3U4_XENLA|nr:hypothetical protein XELAEV_18021971mg [Xenopus laevis]